MKFTFSKFVLLGATALVLSFSACKTKDSATTQPETAAEDNSNALYESDDVINFSANVMDENKASMQKTASSNRETQVLQTEAVCNAIVTVVSKTQANPTGTLTIDFGSTPKTCSDGRTRQGKVIITFTGKFGDPGKTQVITLQDYYVNGNKVEGTKTLSSTIDGAKLVTTINVHGGKITYTDGNFLTWNSSRVRTYDTKGTYLDLSDDVMTVTGTASGTSRNGIAYTVNITNPLTYTLVCATTGVTLPVSGTLEISPAGVQKRVIDYGSGACDRKLTITVGSTVIEYEVKK